MRGIKSNRCTRMGTDEAAAWAAQLSPSARLSNGLGEEQCFGSSEDIGGFMHLGRETAAIRRVFAGRRQN
jgi:hypothetical protein